MEAVAEMKPEDVPDGFPARATLVTSDRAFRFVPGLAVEDGTAE